MKCAICAIAKNENLYINDWCKWHLNLGFDQIYLFDNNDKSTKFVGDFIDKSIKDRVNIIPVNEFKQFQKRAYNDYYRHFAKRYDWHAFIDIDEFIVISAKYKSVKEVLSKFNNNQMIRLNWQLYGDDGIISGDVKVPVYERIKKKLDHEYNYHAKCIFPGNKDNVDFVSVHYALCNGKMLEQVLPNKTVLDPSEKIVLKHKDYSEMYIAHYMTKTWEEFKAQKLNRTDAALTRILKEDYFARINPETYNKIKGNL